MKTKQDLYPSRIDHQPRMTPRQDPVLHGEAASATEGPLDRKQLKQYEARGFIVLENLFSGDEVQRIKRELDRMARSTELKQRPEAITEPTGNELRSVFYIHKLNELFDNLSRDPRVLEIARQILGSDVYIHQSRANLKPGFAGKDFYWHSDFETWHVEDGMPRMRAVSCSILLTDNYAYNGSLMLIPGSHNVYVSCVGQTPEDHYKSSLKEQKYGVPDEQSLSELVDQGGISVATGPAGSVLFFECNTMHGSNSNITPYPRSNAFFVYNSVENTLEEPFGGTRPRPEFIATREDFSPLEVAESAYLRR